MKSLKKYSILLLLTAAIASCKKTGVQPTVNEKRVTKISFNGINPVSYTYNGNGTIAQYQQQDDKIVFEYGSSFTGWRRYAPDSYQEIIKNLKFENGKIKAYTRELYKYGALTFSYPVTFEYDAEGRLVVLKDHIYTYNYDYNNGNVSKLTILKNGSLYEVSTFEYYYQEPNKFNIPLQEVFFLGYKLTDRQFQGKGNNNLIKNVSTTGQGYTLETFLEYKTDTQGYVIQWSQNTSKNNAPFLKAVIDVTY